MLIIVITFDQFSYDNFHSKKDRIYRVLSTNTISTESFNELATSPIPLGAEVFRNTSTIEDYIVINNSFSGDISYEGSTLALNGLYVSENFFNLFDFPLIGGAPDKVLVDLYTMVLTEDAAKKNFGKNEAIGKEIMLDSIIYKVTGIIPKTKIKSHIQFEGIASLSSLVAKAKMKGEKDPTLNWKNYWSSYTYFLIKEGVNPESLYPLLDKIGAEHYATDDEHKFKFNFQPLTKITPGPLLSNELGMSMPKPFIIFLAGLALVIIVSAAFNYTSLSVARSLLRAKEVGVRKTLGATKGQIITQFLFEAVMIAILSSFVGFIILQALIPGFSGMKLMSMIQIRPEQNISIYIWFFCNWFNIWGFTIYFYFKLSTNKSF
jgi:ABC-type antimicrobial peptide transport system permease subunit